MRKAAYIPFSTAVPKKAVIDLDNCILCGACERVCPAGCIDFTQMPQELEFNVGSVIISTGFKLFPPERREEYGYGKYKNVITAAQMERLLAPTRPYNTVLRPSDGKVPESIAYVLCTGSRDHKVGNVICSRICCIYSLKHVQLLMGILPLADFALYYQDIRAFGKGYEEFYQQTKSMGAMLIKGRVAKIEEKENGNLIVHYEDIDNGGVKRQAEHDLVVLSIGLLPNTEVLQVFKGDALLLDDFGFTKEVEEDIEPSGTNVAGVFIAGTGSGPLDIPDSILHAGAAAAQAAAYVGEVGEGDEQEKDRRLHLSPRRNISDYVDVEKVRKAVGDEEGVMLAKNTMFACSDAAQQEMIEDIKEKNLDAMVVASCSPKLHLYTLRGVAERAGLNPYQYIQVNLREQDSWAHTDDPQGATEKAIRLVRAGIKKAGLGRSLGPVRIDTVRKTLIIGAGIAGLRAAVGLADLGIPAFRIEKEREVGGWVRKFKTMYPHEKMGHRSSRSCLKRSIEGKT